MTLLFDGQNAFFAERGKSFSTNLVIHLPDGCSLFFNGVCYTPKENSVLFPQDSIRMGQNALALRMGNRIFPTEGLIFDGEAFIPAGLATDALLLQQHALIASLTDKLSYLSKRLESLEKKSAARTLFS